jgi:hypothetical protein
MLTGLARIHIPDQGQSHAPSHPYNLTFSVSDPVPGSVIWKRFLPDPGSQTSIFEKLMTLLLKEVQEIFVNWLKKFFFTSSKIK